MNDYFYSSYILLLTYLYIANCNRAAVVVDAPAVFLDAVDALGVGTYIVDVKCQDAVVCVDVDVVGVVGGTLEPVAVSSLDETFAFFAFLLEIELAVVIVLGVHYDGVVLLRICATYERYAKLIPGVRSLYGERDVVGCAQTVVEYVCSIAAQ